MYYTHFALRARHCFCTDGSFIKWQKFVTSLHYWQLHKQTELARIFTIPHHINLKVLISMLQKCILYLIWIWQKHRFNRTRNKRFLLIKYYDTKINLVTFSEICLAWQTMGRKITNFWRYSSFIFLSDSYFQHCICMILKDWNLYLWRWLIKTN